MWKVKGDPVAATPYSMKSRSKTDEMAALVRSPDVRASSEEKEKSRDAGKASSGQDQLVVRQAMGTEGEMAVRVQRMERGMEVMEKDLDDVWSIGRQHHRAMTWLIKEKAVKDRQEASRQLEVGN